MTQAAPLQVANAAITHSNGATRVLQRKCACGSSASALTGECEECGKHRMLGVVSNAGDRRERDADWIADEVMRNAGLRSSGRQSLEPATEALAEPRFGCDFRRVRVHAGLSAAAAAAATNARATLGRDPVPGPAQYAPETQAGRRLLAHELTNTLSAGAAILRSPATEQPRPPNKGKRPDGFLGWWLRHRVPAGFRIVTARRVRRAQRLLSGEFDLTPEERRLLLELVRRGRVEAAAETPEKGTRSLAQGEAAEDESAAEAQAGPRERGEEAGAEEDSLLNGPFSTPEEAAHGFAERYNPISKSTNQEVCSIIVEKDGQFFFLDGWQAAEAGERTHSCPVNPPSARERRTPRNFAGQLHTHGGADPAFENETPSPTDRAVCRELGGPCFLVTPSDRVMQYGPDPTDDDASHAGDTDSGASLEPEGERNGINADSVQVTGASSLAKPVPTARAVERRRKDRRSEDSLRQSAWNPFFVHYDFQNGNRRERAVILREMAKQYGGAFAATFKEWASKPDAVPHIIVQTDRGGATQYWEPDQIMERGFVFVYYVPGATERVEHWVHPQSQYLIFSRSEASPLPKPKPPGGAVAEFGDSPEQIDPNAVAEEYGPELECAEVELGPEEEPGVACVYASGLIEWSREGGDTKFYMPVDDGKNYRLYLSDGKATNEILPPSALNMTELLKLLAP